MHHAHIVLTDGDSNRLTQATAGKRRARRLTCVEYPRLLGVRELEFHWITQALRSRLRSQASHR